VSATTAIVASTTRRLADSPQLTTISSVRPSSFVTCGISCSMLALSARSATTMSALPPAASMASLVCVLVVLRWTRMRSAPALDSARAILAPMPRVPPVILYISTVFRVDHSDRRRFADQHGTD